MRFFYGHVIKAGIVKPVVGIEVTFRVKTISKSIEEFSMSEHTITSLRSPSLLNRILDQPGLVELVQHLEPEVLTRLIRRIGLEDAAEIVSMASADQLQQVFDEDLWQSRRPGEDELFDAGRFILWLEVLQESGPGYAAEKVRGFDEDMLTLALSRHLLVLDRDNLFLRMNLEEDSQQADLIEKTLDSSLCCEFDQFFVISRDSRAWEPIASLLAELNEIDYALFNRILHRCVINSTEFIEDSGGLYDVLSSAEMLAVDVAGDREERRHQRGYVVPSAARAFLSTLRTRTIEENAGAAAWDPDTQRYFRKMQSYADADRPAASENRSRPEVDTVGGRRFAALLEEAEILDPPRYVKQIEMGAADDEQIAISKSMQLLRAKSPNSYDERLSEISYLANVLISGCSFQDRQFRPVEAAEAALATCQLGIESVLRRRLDTPDESLLEDVAALLVGKDAVRLFGAGWRILHEKVAMPAAKTLSALIGQVKDGNREKLQIYELAALMDLLDEKIKAGQPWLFVADSDDPLRYLDNDLLLPLMGLLHEYPTLHGVMAVKEGKTGPSLISNQGQVKWIETWLSGLLKKTRT